MVRTHYYHVGSRELRSPSIQLLNKFRRGRNDASLALLAVHSLAFLYRLFATTSSYRSRGVVASRAAIARAIAGSNPHSAFGIRHSAFGIRLSVTW